MRSVIIPGMDPGESLASIHEILDRELYEICSGQLGDVDDATRALAAWLAGNPDRVDPNV